MVHFLSTVIQLLKKGIFPCPEIHKAIILFPTRLADSPVFPVNLCSFVHQCKAQPTFLLIRKRMYKVGGLGFYSKMGIQVTGAETSPHVLLNSFLTHQSLLVLAWLGSKSLGIKSWQTAENKQWSM